MCVCVCVSYVVVDVVWKRLVVIMLSWVVVVAVVDKIQ